MSKLLKSLIYGMTAVIGGVFSIAVEAAPITMTFEGQVRSGHDAANLFTADADLPFITNKVFRQTFIFDPELNDAYAPGGVYSPISTTSGNDVSVETITTVGDATFAATLATGMNAFGLENRLTSTSNLFDSVKARINGADSIGRSMSMNFQWISSVDNNFLSSSSFDQQLKVYFETGDAFINHYRVTDIDGAITSLFVSLDSFSLNMPLPEQINPDVVNVPEPSILAILGLGLLGMTLGRRRV